jgi:DNA-binding MarR family transcriptional regulator
MKNKNEYCKAIESTGLLSKGQKKILKYILAFDQNNGVTADSIRDFAKITRQAANVHLQRLLDRGFVTREKNRVYVYFVKQKKIEEILEEYKIIQYHK